MKIVAIDGPAGSGKGTIAKMVSEACNLVNIDTGATYRCVTLKAIKEGISFTDELALEEISKNINIMFTPDCKVLLDNEDVTNDIRSKAVNEGVSIVSSVIKVRENMVNFQKKLAANYDCILEGRDITTVVFPNAQYKFYLDASVDERSKRRFIQNEKIGIDIPFEEIKKNIEERDYNDMNKPVGALKRTDEQIYIDTTSMTIEEVANKIINIVKGEK